MFGWPDTYTARLASTRRRAGSPEVSVAENRNRAWVPSVVMARHIVRAVPESFPAHWMLPVVHVNDATANQWPEPEAKRQVCVQGFVDFKRHNYKSLLDALAELRTAGLQNWQVHIVGRNHIPAGKLLRKQVAERGLAAYFSFSRRPFICTDVSYKNFYKIIAQTEFLLPLVDGAGQVYSAYLTEKLSSAVIVAMGLGRIPVLHAKLAALYGIEDAAVAYPDGGLADALRRAFGLAPERLLALRAALWKKRTEELLASRESIRLALHELGLPV